MIFSMKFFLIALRAVRRSRSSDRKITKEDFENVLSANEIVPSLNEQTELIKELKKWNSLYGAGKSGYKGGAIGF